MKKILMVITTGIFLTQNVIGQMRYNPLNNLIYSYPETPEISQDEYRALLAGCIQIEARLGAMHNGYQPSKKDVLEQCEVYLNAVGTPTALRAIADLKSNTVYYANGSFMKNIF